jgi:diaminopimelate epimerase
VTTLNFAKGHGTLNDFVLVLDADDHHPLDAETVRWLCDRRAGIGGDGLLRAVKAASVPEWDGDPALWFMDYRNADGSIAEMCGNGLRVFVRHLLELGLVAPGAVQIATRAGLRTAWPQPDGRITVDVGRATVVDQPTWVDIAGRRCRAITVDVGNPHAVVVLADQLALAGLDLSRQPGFDSQVYPSGTNIEFVVPRDDHDLQMRVHERGVGETMSCGTGVVAAAAAHLAGLGQPTGTVHVSVPGGDLNVEQTQERAYLTGPAVVVAHGSVVLPS